MKETLNLNEEDYKNKWEKEKRLQEVDQLWEILKNIVWLEWYESHLPEWVRLYKNEDYNKVDVWMKDLAKFYDWHTDDNKLLDQLVGTHEKDENWYFTKNKLMLMIEDEGQPVWMVCVNIKRWWSVKIGPVVVDPNIRWKWIWKKLFSTIDNIANDFQIRKLYATTSHLNERVNNIFEKFGYIIEAKFPDQYKQWSEEYIWGKIKNDKVIKDVDNIEHSANKDIESIWDISINESLSDDDIDYLKDSLIAYLQRHNDLWDDFMEMMIKGFERGQINLNYQNKGKKILVAKDSEGNYLWTLTFSPKRGGPVKIYPISWTTEAQKLLIEKSLEIAKEYGCHKLYTFAHELDEEQIKCLEEIGFQSRWKLVSPYKDWHNLVPFDLFVN